MPVNNLLRIGGKVKHAARDAGLILRTSDAVPTGSGALRKQIMKSREERQKVMIKARMRIGASWKDVCIHNVSVRGLGIQMAEPPPRGSYIEICKGTQSIVARVVWAKGHRAGLRSQDPIFIKALTKDGAVHKARCADGQSLERRRVPRPVQQSHDQSRIAGYAMEFLCLTLFVSALAVAAFGAVEEALAAPLSQIRSALG